MCCRCNPREAKGDENAGSERPQSWGSELVPQTDDDTGDSAPVGDTFLGGRGSVNQQSAERDSSPTSVLGLFEKMRRMHSQAKENFEVVELPTQQQHEDFEEVSQQEEQERFQALQEQLRQRQVEG